MLLVGEAAGLLNPYTADGIAYGVESGTLAATVAARHLAQGTVPTFAYARRLEKRYPRLVKTREAAHHFRALGSGAIYESNTRSGLLAAATWNFVLDRPPPLRFWESRLRGRALRGAVRELFNFAEGEIAARIGTIDTVASMLAVDVLRDPRSNAGLPLVIAPAVAPPLGLRDSILRNALLAIVLFALAHDILAEVDDRPGSLAQAPDKAAILMGDCLLTDGGLVASGLPDTLFRPIADAFLGAANERLAASTSAAAGTYAPLRAAAAVAQCTATVVSRSSGLCAADERALVDDAREVATAYLRSVGASAAALDDGSTSAAQPSQPTGLRAVAQAFEMERRKAAIPSIHRPGGAK